MTKQEVFDQCSIIDNVVKLPNIQLDRKLYMEVAKSLELIGGKWNRKVQGFLFPNDPSEMMGRVQDGEIVNLKKDYQFFETPAELADYLVELANIAQHHNVLEPSAGRGAIVNAIVRANAGHIVDCCEIWDLNRCYLTKIPNVIMVNVDFLEYTADDVYDRIVANPPFRNNQDIDHVLHMYECLKSGGRMVSIMSKHWQFAGNKKETDFRNWLDSVDAEVISVDAGTFKESGTNIETCIVVIDKP